jgi:hypothetical protein
VTVDRCPIEGESLRVMFLPKRKPGRVLAQIDYPGTVPLITAGSPKGHASRLLSVLLA